MWGRFQSDEVLQFAVMRAIQIIGEASARVSTEYQEAHPEVPWRSMVGMRNRLVHEYFRIIPERAWAVVEVDIPQLLDVLRPLVPPEESREAHS